MRALHFGAGNIGRGFIGKLLYEAGCDVVFGDVVPALINELKARKSFTVRVVGAKEQRDQVKIIDAVFSNSDAILDEIVKADIITTAVGPRILELIAPTIARGLAKRFDGDQKQLPLNIIACENAIRATSGLKVHVEKALKTQGCSAATTDAIWKCTGFVDSAVDRIVPPAKHEDPLEVTVEDFCEWIVDGSQFAGEAPKIQGMQIVPDLTAFIERKLLTVNTGHAITAYLGKLYGYTEIRTSIEDPDIHAIVEGAMRESGAVLCAKFKMDPQEHEMYIQKILKRYANPHIVDDVSRVGREPLRKLRPDDRLVGPLRGALALGLPHSNLVKGVAAALLYEDPSDEQAVQLRTKVDALGWDGALASIANFTDSEKSVSPKILGAVKELNKTAIV